MKWLLKKRKVVHILLALCAIGICFSCEEEYNINNRETSTTQQTFFFYMPWAGSTIYNAFLNNIKHLENAISKNQSSISNKRVLVFISKSDRKSHLFEVKIKNGKCIRDTLQEYTSPTLNTEEGISNIFHDMKTAAPAEKYALLIGSHGMGWLPVGTTVPQSTLAKPSLFGKANKIPRTRYFGHQTDTKFQADIKTLADALKRENLHMGYILFDDCYMANIETAYELRAVTDYLIASTCEIFMEGIPYEKVGTYLLNAEFNNVCKGFLSFYNAYNPPCGTLSVTDCRETEALATVMKRINSEFTLNDDDAKEIQVLDGLTVSIFFDLGDYAARLCKDNALLNQFNVQLSKTVVHKVNTPTFYSDHNEKRIALNAFSGLTVSDPSKNPAVTKNIEKTSWYSATH